MFGNRFAEDDLAKNFLESVTKQKSFKKQAHDKPEGESTSEVRPEDFLVSSEQEVDLNDKDLTDKIESVSSYADDKGPCEKCHQVHESDECKVEKENEAKDETKEKEDLSFLVDKKAEYVLLQLGKIASGLRKKNKGFAADMVEATAIEIKDQTLAKAAQKLQVISGLVKMANKSYQSGDQLTGDVITVTIENIKKSN